MLLGNWRHKVFVPWTITTKEDKGPPLRPSISEYFGFYDWLIDYLFDFCLLQKLILAVKSGQNLWLQQSLLLRDKNDENWARTLHSAQLKHRQQRWRCQLCPKSKCLCLFVSFCDQSKRHINSKNHLYYFRSTQDERDNYTSVPIVVLTVHRAQEEAREQNPNGNFEEEDALPVSWILEKSFAFIQIHYIWS